MYSYSYRPLTNLDKNFERESGHTVSSPLLFDLINDLSKEKHHEIFDVMPATNDIVNAFSAFSCKLYLPGCLHELRGMRSDKYDTCNKLHRALVKNIGFYKNKKAKLNVIFLWDLPNYLDKNIMKGLIEYLSNHIHENVKLHLYIHTRQQMPSSPSIYTIMSDGKVGLEKNVDATIKCPLYFRDALQTLLHPFSVKRSMLLSNGMQEYVLEL